MAKHHSSDGAIDLYLLVEGVRMKTTAAVRNARSAGAIAEIRRLVEGLGLRRWTSWGW